MTSIVICNKSYELTNEPKHGVVRRVRKERQASLKNFILMFKDEVDFNGDLEKELKNIMKSHPSEAIEFGYSEMDFKQRSTISLALNNYFGEEDFDDLTEGEIDDIYNRCHEHLGGDADDFFNALESKSNQNLIVETPRKKK